MRKRRARSEMANENPGKDLSPPPSREYREILYINISTAKMPTSIQIKEKLTAEIKIRQSRRKIPSSHFFLLETGKNSRRNRDMVAVKPVQSPRALQEPKMLSVFPPRTPSERSSGKKRRRIWKHTTTAEVRRIPESIFLACRGSHKTIEDNAKRINAASMNQNDPTSNIMPKKDIPRAEENIAENKNTKTTPNPERRKRERGSTILPSENRAAIQKITAIDSPTMRISPLAAPMGILVKGIKTTGSRTIVKKRDQKEILSKVFDHISYI